MTATMTEKELCERIGISRITAYRLRQSGVLPHFRVGSRQVRYSEKHVEQFLARCERDGAQGSTSNGTETVA